MVAYSIQFKNGDRQKIDSFIDFVKTLDFVQSVESISTPESGQKKAAKNHKKSDYQTVEQIREAHPDEWVLLADPVMDDLEIVGGTVIFHDPEKRNMAVHGKDLIKKYKNVTHFYTGKTSQPPALGMIRKKQML